MLGVASGVQVSRQLRKRTPRADPLVCATGLLLSAPFLYLAIVFAQASTVATYVSSPALSPDSELTTEVDQERHYSIVLILPLVTMVMCSAVKELAMLHFLLVDTFSKKSFCKVKFSVYTLTCRLKENSAIFKTGLYVSILDV